MRTLTSIILAVLVYFSAPAQEKPVQTFDIPIFAYHRFGDDRYPSTNTSVEVFESQLKYLKNNNFTVLSLGDALDRWEKGTPMPDKPVILTVDDGYLSFYKNGLPLLKKYGYPATIFVQTGTVGGDDFMNWQQLKNLPDASIEIGCHSDSHAHFVDNPKKDRAAMFRADLQKADRLFEEHLGKVPDLYAYPYGEWTDDMEAVLQDADYRAAVVQKSGVLCESTPQYAIPRFPMGGAFGTLQGFENKSLMKALRVKEVRPDSPFFTENPPVLRVVPVPDKVNLDAVQLFVDGRKTDVSVISEPDRDSFIKAHAAAPLTERRTLYTITAPSLDGKSWHWFSHLWIDPKVKE